MKGPQGQEIEFWTATDLGIVIPAKSEVAGMTSVRELEECEPDGILFMIPLDYTLVQQEILPSGNRPDVKPPQPPGTGSVRGAGPRRDAFTPDRRAASGQFQLVMYPGCGTLHGTWSARRR